MENSQQQARWYVLHVFGIRVEVMETFIINRKQQPQDVILDIVIPEERSSGKGARKGGKEEDVPVTSS